jgi:hypothetical protein
MILAANLYSQRFNQITGLFPSPKYSHVQTMDFDGDNDLDIFIWASWNQSQSYNRNLIVLKNNGNDQFDSLMIDPSISYGSTIGTLNVSDVNSDNIPEILYIGASNPSAFKFAQYSDNKFIKLPVIGLPGLITEHDFADFDRDGAQEILFGLTVFDTYKNIYGQINFGNLGNEQSRWIDINNDGKIDLFNIHWGQYDTYATSSIHINTGSSFQKNSFNYTKKTVDIEKGDYNNDGFEDLIITSYTDNFGNNRTSSLYKNNKNGSFTFVRDFSTANKGKFIDLDNDGDLDVVLFGNYELTEFPIYRLKFYQNNGNDDFSEMPNNSILTDDFGQIRILDYDNDGDNDILFSSYDNKTITRLYINMYVEDNPSKANHAPSIPLNLTEQVNFNSVRLQWNSSTDIETPAASLTYNVYIKRSDGSFLTSPIADLSTGYKKTVGEGNAGYKNFYEINCLEDGKYYWSVQAIDNSNRGSAFAIVDSFEVKGTKPQTPDQLTAITKSDRVIHLTWKDNSAYEEGFIIKMFYDSIPGTRSAGFYECKRVSANTTYCDIENLIPDTKYLFKVEAFNCSSGSGETNSILASTYPIPFSKKILIDNAYGREAEWGDFDRDGDLDILIFYNTSDAYGTGHTTILENNSGTFTDLRPGFPLVESFGSSRNGSCNWVDFNNDGFSDVCLIKGEPFSAKIKFFKNNGNKTFTDIKTDSILDINPGSCGPSFADYDNDGDLDYIMMGYNMVTRVAEIRIYDNSGNGKFTDSGIRNVTGVIKSRMPWCDFDNDGFVDILSNESKPDHTANIAIFRNNGNKTFTKVIYSNLPGLDSDYLNQDGDMRWGDFNNDGYADILISGANTSSTGSGITRIYKNNGDETFTDSGITNIYGMARDVSMEWGDFNNDGILDILQTGDGIINGVMGKTRIFYNKNGSFVKAEEELFLQVHQQGMSTAGDFDNDADLDVLNLGQDTYIHHQIDLFDNFQPVKNTRPGFPTGLKATYQNNQLSLTWDKASDNETPTNGLSYNVYLMGPSGLIVPPAAIANGKRTMVGIGNTQYNTIMKVNNLSPGIYKWSVQSVDNCFEGSEFAPENTFDLNSLGINDIQNELLINIYPNPFTEELTIVLPESQKNKCDIIISDLTGRQILNKTNVEVPYNINTAYLNSGIYFLTVKQDNFRCVKKIVKK